MRGVSGSGYALKSAAAFAPAAAPSLNRAREAAVPGKLHAAYVMFGVFVYSGARIALSSAGGVEDPGTFDPLNSLFQAILLLGGLLLTFRYRRQCFATLPRAWPLLLTLTVILLSATWSQSPEHTVRRSVSVFAMVLYILTTYAAFGARNFMRLTLGAMLLIAVGSLGEAVLRPGVGYDFGDYANAVRGLYNQKNGLGTAMLNATLTLGFLVLTRGWLRRRDVAILGFFLFVLVLSRSTTSTLLTLSTAVSTLLLLWSLRGGAWRLTAFTVLAAAAAAVIPLIGVVDMNDLFGFIGKDASLTGRTLIWEAVHPMIDRRPLLGYGYSAFWIVGTERVLTIWRFVDWEAPSAHSGYLDVELQLGLVGLALLFLLIANGLARAFHAFRRGQQGAGAWMVLFMIIHAVLSNNESTLLNVDLQFVTWMLVGMSLIGPAGRGATGSTGEATARSAA